MQYSNYTLEEFIMKLEAELEASMRADDLEEVEHLLQNPLDAMSIPSEDPSMEGLDLLLVPLIDGVYAIPYSLTGDRHNRIEICFQWNDTKKIGQFELEKIMHKQQIAMQTQQNMQLLGKYHRWKTK